MARSSLCPPIPCAGPIRHQEDGEAIPGGGRVASFPDNEPSERGPPAPDGSSGIPHVANALSARDRGWLAPCLAPATPTPNSQLVALLPPVGPWSPHLTAFPTHGAPRGHAGGTHYPSTSRKGSTARHPLHCEPSSWRSCRRQRVTTTSPTSSKMRCPTQRTGVVTRLAVREGVSLA